MEEATRRCPFCDADMTGMRSHARTCRDRKCKNLARTALPGLWTHRTARQCCIVEDEAPCATEARSGLKSDKPMCAKHYARLLKNGDPLKTGRKVRPRNSVPPLLATAAAYQGDDCYYLTNLSGGRLTVQFDGRGYTASRAVWMIHHGDPGSLYVLHNCDNGDVGCVNIRHLRLGTQADNAQDTINAGRAIFWGRPQ